MKKIQLSACIIFLNLIFLSSHAQLQYSDYSKSNKEYVFEENFNNNSRTWKVGNESEREFTIAGGYYTLENYAEKAKLTYRPADFDETNDFEIETSMKYIYGEDLTSHALLWANGNSMDYGFYFTAAGSYKIAYYDGSYKDIVDFTQTSALKRGEFNKFTVRKVGNQYYFFINEIFIYQTDFRDFFGKQIGFQVSSKSKIQIDYVKVAYLKGKSKSNSNNNSKVTSNEDEPPAPISDNNKTSNNKTSSIDPKSYYAKFNRTTFKNENFNGDSEWKNSTTSESVREVKNGYYYFESLIDGFYSTWQTYDEFNENKDFEIETSFKFVTGQPSYENCLIWGASDKKSYRIGFTGNGYYTIYRMVPEVSDYVDYTLLSNIKKTGYNKLTVRKYNGYYYFFVNEEFVFTTKAEPFYGNRFGFLVAKSSTMHIDYLRIYYISK